MPQAIERLLATPMMRPRLPCISVPAGISACAAGPAISQYPSKSARQSAPGRPRPASYTNGQPGPVAPRPAPRPSSGGIELRQQARQLLSLSSGQPAADMLVDGGGVDGPHAAPQRPSFGGDQ